MGWFPGFGFNGAGCATASSGKLRSIRRVEIVEITAFSGSLYAACFLPTLVLGLYWKKGTAGGSLSCVVGGTLTVVLWFLAKRNGWTDIHEVYVGFVVGLVLYLTVPLLGRST